MCQNENRYMLICLFNYKGAVQRSTQTYKVKEEAIDQMNKIKQSIGQDVVAINIFDSYGEE